MLSSESNSWNKGTGSDSHKLLFQFHLKAVPAPSALGFFSFENAAGSGPARAQLALGQEALHCPFQSPRIPQGAAAHISHAVLPRQELPVPPGTDRAIDTLLGNQPHATANVGWVAPERELILWSTRKTIHGLSSSPKKPSAGILSLGGVKELHARDCSLQSHSAVAHLLLATTVADSA